VLLVKGRVWIQLWTQVDLWSP